VSATGRRERDAPADLRDTFREVRKVHNT
jgi:hypothetical protein